MSIDSNVIVELLICSKSNGVTTVVGAVTLMWSSHTWFYLSANIRHKDFGPSLVLRHGQGTRGEYCYEIYKIIL